MITKIGYRNFKCFSDLIEAPLSRINLLTGINGRGKSSILQGLLLMRQSPEHSRTTDQVLFNGSCVELGRFDDVRSTSVSRKEPIEFTFVFTSEGESVQLNYILGENPSDEMVAQVERLLIHGETNSQTYEMELFPQKTERWFMHRGERGELSWRNLLFDVRQHSTEPFSSINRLVDFTRTHYVSADRIGPRDFYPKQTFAEFPNVGAKGEFTANILSKKSQQAVDESICLSAGATTTLIDQAEAWLSKIFDGGRIKVTPTEANIVILTMNSEQSSVTYKPSNVGFGYSYALPIIVSGLIARPGEILIVENPEAHLHPYAQSQISRFLARVAANGVQVYIESHSDHVLNGLRLSVLDGIITPHEMNTLYFDREVANRITPVSIESDGSITNWPDGFFDQANSDLARLLNV
jgi:predicted ATPase